MGKIPRRAGIKLVLAFSMIVFGILMAGPSSYAAVSEVDMLLDLFIKKGVVTTQEAAEFRADVAIMKQEDVAKVKTAVVPEWTEKVKMGGDVRFRTRGDWGKTSGTTAIAKQRVLESVRGRFNLEAKVNDSTYAGTRFEGGSTNPRSGDDTLTGYFNKAFTMFDQYYIRFEASKDMAVNYGKFFSDLKLWAGKFTNPFESSEIVWDTDISPGGVVLQYKSPDLKLGSLPGFNVYSNLGFLWVDESSTFNTDPLLWGYQVGAKTAPFGPMNSTLNISTTVYDFANLKGKTPNTNSAGTNSRTWIGDYGRGIGSSQLGAYKYDYNVFDLLVSIDNEYIAEYRFPHGFLIDFIYNASVHEDNLNKGALVGAYIGKKKVKDAGDWKVYTEWRFIERDAVPDFMPDSNFYGFGTYTNANTLPNVNGLPAAGGTNTKGIKLGVDYMLFKNSVLNFSYFWMKPIKSYDRRNPYSEFLFDILTRF